MSYKETKVHDRKLILILNCLWLLDHTEPIGTDASNKIYKLATNGETFIFLGCKVTRYKNGNLKIQFSDDKLYTEFKTRFNKALEQAQQAAAKRGN